MAAISKFLRLSWREQKLVAGAVLALSAVRIALKALPFATIRGTVAWRYRRLDDKPSRPALERVTWAIEVARGTPAAQWWKLMCGMLAEK